MTTGCSAITKTGEIALFELGLRNTAVRRTTDGLLCRRKLSGRSQSSHRVETNFDFKNSGSSPLARKARWEQLVASQKAGIDVETVKQMEGDKYDAFERKDGPNERSLCGTVERSPARHP